MRQALSIRKKGAPPKELHQEEESMSIDEIRKEKETIERQVEVVRLCIECQDDGPAEVLARLDREILHVMAQKYPPLEDMEPQGGCNKRQNRCNHAII